MATRDHAMQLTGQLVKSYQVELEEKVFVRMERVRKLHVECGW